MKKIIRIGTIDAGNGRWASIFCKATYENGRFSISGVIGPTRNGNALGGCGQIDMEFEHRRLEDNDHHYNNLIKACDINFAPGWDVEKWLDFLDIWKIWHLNDMRANCEHQIGPDWTPQDVTLYHFELTKEARKAKEAAENKALSALAAGETFTPTKYDWQKGPAEIKSTNWLTEKEHPKGYLSKACPVCGYKYGSAWRKVNVPDEVLDFIKSLPDADIEPAWI